MKNIFLADDDADDRDFFKEALNEVNSKAELTTAKDGVELMATLNKLISVPPPPHVIFLDLNMPNKNGFECLAEIRNSSKLKSIPVAIFSTCVTENAIEKTFSPGANCYICKPTSHQLLKKAIETVLELALWQDNRQLPKEKFVLHYS